MSHDLGEFLRSISILRIIGETKGYVTIEEVEKHTPILVSYPEMIEFVYSELNKAGLPIVDDFIDLSKYPESLREAETFKHPSVTSC